MRRDVKIKVLLTLWQWNSGRLLWQTVVKQLQRPRLFHFLLAE